MRILLVHNHYGSEAPSGENMVFNAESAMLRERDHEIHLFERHSDEIRGEGDLGALRGALVTPWNPWMGRAIRREVEKLRPDVVHVHNTFPLISPAIFHAIGNRAARVLTLHNYRLFCPAGIPLRNGRGCTRCIIEQRVTPALRYGCYRGSRLATAPLAANVALHRRLGTWSRQVDAFIALSDFQRQLLLKGGLATELVHVKPNFFPGNPRVQPWMTRRDAAVFAGRLSQEKGIEALVRAWLIWGRDAPELRIVGDGHLAGKLKELAATAPEVRIRFLGQLPPESTRQEIAEARLLVVPSECYEAGVPLVLVEAFAFGTPVAVAGIGPMSSIVTPGENGVVFEPGRPESILSNVKSVWFSRSELEDLAGGARRCFEKNYTVDANYRRLTDIYQRAMHMSMARMAS